MRPRQRRVTVNTEQPGFAYAYYCLGEQVVPHLCSQSLNQEKMAEQAQPCMLTVQVVVQLLSCVQLLRLHGLQPTRLLCPWDFLSKNTRVGYHFLLQGIFPFQGQNLYLLHLQTDSLLLRHQGSPIMISVQFSSVSQPCLTLCDPMDCSMPGFPVHH